MCIMLEATLESAMCGCCQVPITSSGAKSDRQLPTDCIMEWDTDKYFAPSEDQEDEHDTDTISSTSTTDYD